MSLSQSAHSTAEFLGEAFSKNLAMQSDFLCLARLESANPVAYQLGKTIYQLKHGMLSDYLSEQLKHPFVQMTLA